MTDAVAARYSETRKLVGYIPRNEATEETYHRLGYRSGLEVHQQLATEKKLFCRCPAGVYQQGHEFDAELIRHMRPTLSEMGEYDGTALMEKRTRKNIIYRIKDQSACTYDIDDTPPFSLNRQALRQSLQIALLLDCNIVGELHIARKQYLDGSIPTGFQRTGIVGVSGAIPISNKRVGITQISLEEDSCREVSDVGHWRTYTTDRLGMPLIETVTDPDCLTPDELAEACQYLRFLARSTGKVRTGMGAARQDVNASIEGGTRVEIKGVSHITWIAELTHTEAFRQNSLLQIAALLRRRFANPDQWKLRSVEIDSRLLNHLPRRESDHDPMQVWALCLPGFAGVLSYFNQPGHVFADELRGRLKVIACVDLPNFHYEDEDLDPPIAEALRSSRDKLKAGEDDAVAIVWAPGDDIPTALEILEERCRMAIAGVPNETRKAFVNGTTVFERVLPGPDRMYPDTDTAPIPITEELMNELKAQLPKPVNYRQQQLRHWHIPADTLRYLLKKNLVPVLEEIIETCDLDPSFAGTLLGHTLKSAEGKSAGGTNSDYTELVSICREIKQRRIHYEILPELITEWVKQPDMSADGLLGRVGYANCTEVSITDEINPLLKRFKPLKRSRHPHAAAHWVMGQLRAKALGNMPLRKLWQAVKEAAVDE